MNPSVLVAVFAASVVGSVHCAGMCGGFVGFCAGSNAGKKTSLAGQLAYHLGRLATYSTLGAVAGSAGAALDLAGGWAGVGASAAVISGALMTGWGFWVALEALGVKVPRPSLPRALLTRSVGLVSRVRGYPPVLRAGLLGLCTTLLPCGWLYAFVLSAAGAGSAANGALVMAVFWLGTVPMLLGLGLFVTGTARVLRAHLPLISALALITVGLFNLLGRVQAPRLSAESISAAIAIGSKASVTELDVNLPPCHRHAHSP